MPLNSKLLESYNNVRVVHNEASILNSTKEKVLNLFRKKARNGVLDVDGERFTEDMIRGALDTLADEDTINDFLSFLGLKSATIAETKDKNLAPESVASYVLKHTEQNDFNKVVITTHYGNNILPVVEVWSKDGTLNITVDNTVSNKI